VRISDARVEVSADGVRATVTRRPFRLAVTDGQGRPALAEVENTGQPPFPVAPTPEPVPLGRDDVRRPALYAPLVFTVGQSRTFQYPAAQWEGNQLAGTEAGVQYAARDVVQAAAAGAGARLVVGTGDPSGRHLVVTLTPARGQLRVSVRPDPPDGVAAMGDAFTAGPSTAFHGFGGRTNALDQRGQDFYDWVEQENLSTGSAPSPGGETYKFPNGPTAAYYVQSMFVSDAFGFLLDRDELARWRLASDRPDAWQVAAAARGLDYVVAPGRAAEAIGTLTAISGRHRVPPAWAAGDILDRLVIFPDKGPDVYRASVEADLRDIDRYGLPLDAYRIEGWQFLSRGYVHDVIRRLHARGIRALVYFRLFVGKDTIGTDDPKAYDEAVDKGYVATTPTGQPYVFAANFNERTAVIDFTDPAAIAWWKGRIREAIDLGADGFMQDFGEQVQVDMRFHDGSTGAEMHNRLPVLAHRATREAIDASGREVWFYTRTGHSGSPGSAAYEGGNFAGDNTTDWSRSFGIGSVVPDMLNRSVGGLYGFATDIGGYFDVGPYEPTTKELFLRWAELAALSPHFRLHGSAGAGTHTPWSYDAETVQIYNVLSRLHLRARPLILRLWRDAVRTGMPVTRPLWLAAPGDAEAARADQEWLLGDDVLVAPVVTEGATSRAVRFPPGCWQHAESGARYDGPRTATVTAALDQLPYFARCGTQPFDAADASGAATLPRTCRSRRRFTIRLSKRLVAARVYVNGRRVRAVRGRRARVDLRGLPRGRFVVRVAGRSRAGRTLVSTRAYRTCVPRRRG
jgi:alpha-glucosidase (family GH31 glycosyl hydrolase)